MDWKESKNNFGGKMIKIKKLFEDKSKDEVVDEYIELYKKNMKLNREKEKMK